MSLLSIRIGIDSPRAAILALNLPMLVSANSLWHQERRAFSGWGSYLGRDIALDSSGFVAMKLYGGYRWSVFQYASLAQILKPAWWAQMDYCCEPEIARSRAEIESRINKTIHSLGECRAAAQSIGSSLPMPVLQGYEPTDYVSGPLYNGPIPPLLGVGSICRRPLKGKSGLMAVIDRIDSAVPASTTLYLFGVKGPALQTIVREFPSRNITVDSMAYSYSARVEARSRKIPNSSLLRANHAQQWLNRNIPVPDPQYYLTFPSK